MLGVSRDRLLEKLVPAVARWSAASPEDVVARWRGLSETIGRRVRIVLPGRSVEGLAQDIGAAGELIVDGAPMTAGSLVYLGD